MGQGIDDDTKLMEMKVESKKCRNTRVVISSSFPLVRIQVNPWSKYRKNLRFLQCNAYNAIKTVITASCKDP